MTYFFSFPVPKILLASGPWRAFGLLPTSVSETGVGAASACVRGTAMRLGFYEGSALALTGIRGIVYCRHWQEQAPLREGAVLQKPDELAF